MYYTILLNMNETCYNIYYLWYCFYLISYFCSHFIQEPISSISSTSSSIDGVSTYNEMSIMHHRNLSRINAYMFLKIADHFHTII